MAEDKHWFEQPWPAWEDHWLSDDSIESMCKTLGGMEDQGGSPLSRRKLRLFTAACLRRIQHVFKDQRNRCYIDTVDELADGLITSEEGMRRWGALGEPPNRDAPSDPNDSGYPHEDNPVDCACTALGFASGHDMDVFEAYTSAAWAALASPDQEEEAGAQVSLLRCLFGNPFRPSPPLPAAVLAWDDGTVRRIARGIYEERRMPEGTLDTARLAILADALLDAGCEDEALIQQCRSDGPHVRGCWAVDLILGKG